VFSWRDFRFVIAGFSVQTSESMRHEPHAAAEAFPFFLADDLSGALDAAAGFFIAGWPVRVVLSAEGWREVRAGELVAFSTETRNAAPALAARAVTAALAAVQARGGRLVYKKIDSTLRGPVAAELAALLAARTEWRVLFAPANPRAGRTVRGGVLRVHGVPVHETAFARDPASPVRESAIPRLLAAGIDRERLRRVTIADAETEADLARAVAEMAAAGGEWIGVGSGALAVPVAAALAGVFRPQAKRIRAPGVAPDGAPVMPLLFVSGSAHPANRAQLARLGAARGVAAFEVIPRPGAWAAAAEVREALRAGRSIALVLPPHDAAHPVSRDAALAALVEAVMTVLGAKSRPAGEAQAVLRAPESAAGCCGCIRIFATGGDTARAVSARLGIGSMMIRREIAAGIVLAEAQAGAWGDVLMAVKPGGFGSDDAWLLAHDALVSA
jgi:uncharacterized protein YgbK (DUF1537 family)